MKEGDFTVSNINPNCFIYTVIIKVYLIITTGIKITLEKLLDYSCPKWEPVEVRKLTHKTNAFGGVHNNLVVNTFKRSGWSGVC